MIRSTLPSSAVSNVTCAGAPTTSNFVVDVARSGSAGWPGSSTRSAPFSSSTFTSTPPSVVISYAVVGLKKKNMRALFKYLLNIAMDNFTCCFTSYFISFDKRYPQRTSMLLYFYFWMEFRDFYFIGLGQYSTLCRKHTYFVCLGVLMNRFRGWANNAQYFFPCRKIILLNRS